MTERIAVTWPEVRLKLVQARTYWIATAGAAGRPHAAPVWGVWLDGLLYFSTGTSTVKARHIGETGRVVVHLDSGDDVVIVEGRASRVTDPAEIGRADAAYAEKYVLPRSGEPAGIDVGAGGFVFRVEPVLGHTWFESAFPETMLRWHFTAAGDDPVPEETSYG